VLFTIILFFGETYFAIRDYPFRKHNNKSQDLSLNLKEQTKLIASQLAFRYITVFNPDINYYDFFQKYWTPKSIFSSRIFNSKINHSKYKKGKDEQNLLYNGKFIYGLLFWEPEANATKHMIVNTPYGKGVKVSRFDGDDRNYSLSYEGRPIVFYKNHNYKFEFKYKVDKGNDCPFKIGFWAADTYWGYGESNSLDIKTIDLGKGWKEGTCSYTFLRSHFNIPLFMNSQSDSTIIEFTDIKLTDENRNLSLAQYVDEISNNPSEIEKYLFSYDSILDPGLSLPDRKINLFYNGDFKLGTQFWSNDADSTQHEIIKTPWGEGIRVSRTDGNGGWWSLKYDGRPIIYYSGHQYRIIFDYKVIKGGDQPFRIGWWVKEYNSYSASVLPLTIKNLEDGWKEATCSHIFNDTYYNLPTFLNSLQDFSIVDIDNVQLIDLNRIDSLPLYVDQIKQVNESKQKNKLISSDSIDYLNNKNQLTSSRTNRWLYSMVVFKDSLSIPQKIFGCGFDYLEMYGKEFGEAKYDWPHNPVISSFLYSGIIGGLAFTWFMIMVIVNYIIYLKRHTFFFISFVITFFFVFFSDTSLFNTPLFTFLCIIPFFTRYLYLKEIYNNTRDIPLKKILFW
jgi:hypothetical protein